MMKHGVSGMAKLVVILPELPGDYCRTLRLTEHHAPKLR